MLAASEGHEAAMKVLLQAGADLTVQDQVSE
jgi:ankyrin repeat protein